MPATLNLLADNIWEITHPLSVAGMQLGHRMTVVRLASGDLWVHSPVALDPILQTELAQLGPMQYLIAPNTFHDLYWQPYFAAYTDARFCCAPGFQESHGKLSFTDTLDDNAPDAWAQDIDQLVVAGVPRFNETVFLHKASGTLIAADLAFNVVSDVGAYTRFMLTLTGTNGHFAASRLFKAFIKDAAAMRRSIDQILAWDFDRILVGHGEVLESGGRKKLEDTYSFLK